MLERHNDGASAVEFALIFPLLIMLIFGGLTAGLALDAKQQINHAAREGARYAATLPDDPAPCGAGTTWAGCVRDRTMVAASGSLNLAEDGICVALISSTGATSASHFGSSTGSPGAPCYTETPAVTGARVQVRALREVQINAVFFRPTILMSSEAVAVFEKEDAP